MTGAPLLRVADLYPCIQGEGFLAGTPMVLVRLQGCSVGCPWCDTKETWDPNGHPHVSTVMDLVDAVLREKGPSPWVLLTGGEPLEHDPVLVADLARALHEAGMSVALETSGTKLVPDRGVWDWVTVSPKVGMPGGREVLTEALVSANEIKMVVGRMEDVEVLDELLARLVHKPRVSLQPVSQSPKATALCVAMCKARGWRLSLQLHKYLGER